ncbi:hypothetical protein [Planobispora rosea]|nr:hypothetical protein [Planobispora rosea]
MSSGVLGLDGLTFPAAAASEDEDGAHMIVLGREDGGLQPLAHRHVRGA